MSIAPDRIEDVHEIVRGHYAEAARRTAPDGAAGCCAGDDCCGSSASCCAGEPAPAGDASTAIALYPAADLATLPDAAVLASLGCGNPIAVAELRPGERVLDLGSGGGIDVLLSAERVGPTGRAFGLDMTDEMLALGRANATVAGASNVEFLKGEIESIPLPADSIDVVISNCVVNLAADKPAVFREIARVLRPGGRLGIADIVAQDRLSPAERAERGSWAGCIAGALSFSEIESGLTEAGLVDVSITVTHEVADGIDSAIVRASKPETPGVQTA